MTTDDVRKRIELGGNVGECPSVPLMMLCDVVDSLASERDRYGVALMMIRDGVEDPSHLAAKTLNKHPTTAEGGK